RLEIVAAYERAGFRSYHVAEHHLTPLGMAPSPSVFLAAVAQRSQRLRFGPTPLRHAHVSSAARRRGSGDARLFEPRPAGIGTGARGASPIEIAGFDVDPANAPTMNREATALILKALTSETVNFEGKFYRCKNVRIEARPLQQPYPPLWFAPIEAGRAADAARLKGNMVTLIPDAGVKALTAATAPPGKSRARTPRICLCSAPSATSWSPTATTKPTIWRVQPIGSGGAKWAFLWEWAGLPFPIA